MDMVEKVVSGGQTGADRAALDVALELGVPCGGWIPKGRLAEDGVIPERYPGLHEADTEAADVRTTWNVRDSDATILLSHGPLAGGSLYTKEMAEKLDRPYVHLDLSVLTVETAARRLREWLSSARPRVVNVAGPRASEAPEIYDETRRLLRAVLHRPRDTGAAASDLTTVALTLRESTLANIRRWDQVRRLVPGMWWYIIN